MRRSNKFSISDLREITATIELEEEKTIEYEGHSYVYTVLKYTIYKSYYSVTVTGGPHEYSATTTCKGPLIKKKIKAFIKLLQHK